MAFPNNFFFRPGIGLYTKQKILHLAGRSKQNYYLYPNKEKRQGQSKGTKIETEIGQNKIIKTKSYI